jgi:hypothetical protein
MFGVLVVIPEFSSPDVRDFTDVNTLFSDIHNQNHQNHRHRPDHNKNRNKLNHYNVSKQEELVL